MFFNNCVSIIIGVSPTKFKCNAVVSVLWCVNDLIWYIKQAHAYCTIVLNHAPIRYIEVKKINKDVYYVYSMLLIKIT